MKQIRTFLVASTSVLILISGCSSLNKTQKGAIIGTGAGAAVGAGVGKLAGNTALGAIIGAAVGGVTGGLIGKKMDKQAKEIENIPGAEVTRVGEGINVTFNSGVLFAVNQSTFNEASKANMRELVTVLTKYPDTYVRIEGHTDASGTDAINNELSEKRAVAVAQFLKDLGVADSRLKTAWYGETQPKFPNDTPDNMAKNRRVEFAIYANEKMKADAQKEAGSSK
ncbi:MAG: OmpA family protein [Pedobacter sp.]|nr:OmpA family protein [Chitinophagaceae bacterium]